MSFIRPEASEKLMVLRPFIIAGAMALFGCYILFTTRGVGYVMAVLILGIAVMIAHDSYRRLMFPAGGGGQGLVEVDERQITYLSGDGGGAISIEDLTRVEVHRNDRNRITWILYSPMDALSVPANAVGSEALFDALVALPGVDHSQVQAAVTGKGIDIFLVWKKDHAALH